MLFSVCCLVPDMVCVHSESVDPLDHNVFFIFLACIIVLQCAAVKTMKVVKVMII